MTEPIIGRVAEVLDSYRIVVNRGADDGVAESMKFRVFATRGITDPERQRRLRTLEIDKAVVTPKDIYDKMTLMETKTETYSVPMSQIVSNIPNFSKMPKTKQDKIKTDANIDEDIEIVRIGDSVEQIIDTDDSDVSEEPKTSEDSPTES